MGSAAAPWPDIEELLLHVLADLTTGTVVTVTPPDLQQHLPVIRVRRLGGSDNRVSDTARVDVDVYAATRAEAHALGEAVRQRLLVAPHVVAGPSGGVIDRVVTEVAPHSVTHPDPGTRRVTATYRTTARRSTSR
ncbi:tail completion protein gp17 [Actinomadura rudentiformis]|uniref:DUF3168 domain-containing protein n=1 Tax=Actinomadura rudentiformis TaxID=359158 RepID=A0A6H9YUA8_9ACTN|nr:DUF3168 domain-containing protein [Actinomadura rudentiformis]KAB2344878.1 DUF3168 domain-containing protein [Actinomadura rudentiformis]